MWICAANSRCFLLHSPPNIERYPLRASRKMETRLVCAGSLAGRLRECVHEMYGWTELAFAGIVSGFVAIFAGVLGGCKQVAPPTQLSALNAQQARGHGVFQAHCSQCHYDRAERASAWAVAARRLQEAGAAERRSRERRAGDEYDREWAQPDAGAGRFGRPGGPG